MDAYQRVGWKHVMLGALAGVVLAGAPAVVQVAGAMTGAAVLTGVGAATAGGTTSVARVSFFVFNPSVLQILDRIQIA